MTRVILPFFTSIILLAILGGCSTVENNHEQPAVASKLNSSDSQTIQHSQTSSVTHTESASQEKQKKVSVESEKALIEQSKTSKGTQKVSSNLYTVQPMDTLWAIARTNKITVNCLMKANQMDAKDKLMAGQELIIPSKSSC
ncbi:LysM peptidoglycan-binding domain-containing protein [Fangia hongkongensis]|uniref:LysM peptidoglycan-binding domain-containing protein n=1 Tax=Fangia hongkongensis TaxID=270495 RepID=UPI000370EFA6|nr:LysM peptidoglycan-binding domain-containing protein [Fangia hongkongensis]MBK2123990.1 LysM peptidoglycan-binding domain-containing protein [Fangia hongkongensis]